MQIFWSHDQDDRHAHICELKFHVKTPYAKLAKSYTKYFGHMTKMTLMPIYGKNPLKNLFSRTRRQVTLGHGI